MATAKRRGCQVPTQSVVLPYSKSKGKEAIKLYQQTGRKAIEWQKTLIEHILAYNKDKLWVHTKFGYSVPRRNGKNEIAAIREFFGLVNGEKILHTAHRTTTSHSASVRLAKFLNDAGYEEVQRVDKKKIYDKHYTYSKQFGLERITILGENGGQCDFRTRSGKGGLGEGFDLLIIDEAQEYTQEQESALKYVVTDSKNPQTLFCGTPPTAVSSGTVFLNFRNELLAGDEERRYFEDPWMSKINGKYYFSYSTGTTHYLCYAEGEKPEGPFTYKGRIMEPVLGWTTHHSILEIDGEWYIFYHDCELSKGITHERCVKYTKLNISEDGTIETIHPYDD